VVVVSRLDVVEGVDVLDVDVEVELEVLVDFGGLVVDVVAITGDCWLAREAWAPAGCGGWR
jgi:hypothetical protein